MSKGYDRKIYRTYLETKRVAIKMGIKNSDEYFARYKEDPLLPSHPDIAYPKQWVNWYDFLDREGFHLYESYQEFEAAVREKGIKDSIEYQRRRNEDKGFPARPFDVYRGRGWVSWYKLFGKLERKVFYTKKESQKVCRKNKTTTFKAYRILRKKFPKLPSEPHKVWGDKFIGYNDLLGVNHHYPRNAKS